MKWDKVPLNCPTIGQNVIACPPKLFFSRSNAVKCSLGCPLVPFYFFFCPWPSNIHSSTVVCQQSSAYRIPHTVYVPTISTTTDFFCPAAILLQLLFIFYYDVMCLSWFIPQSFSEHGLDAQNSKANADTQLKNSQDNHGDVNGCQQTLP